MISVGGPDGIWTRVAALKGLSPRPLDDGAFVFGNEYISFPGGYQEKSGKTTRMPALRTDQLRVSSGSVAGKRASYRGWPRKDVLTLPLGDSPGFGMSFLTSGSGYHIPYWPCIRDLIYTLFSSHRRSVWNIFFREENTKRSGMRSGKDTIRITYRQED